MRHMNIICDQCKCVVHGVPWVAMRQGSYAYLCTPVCKERYENETARIAWTQRSLELGWKAVNGA